MAVPPTAVISTPRCKISFIQESALYSTSPDSREPFTKKSKLHNLKIASARRRATNSPLPESRSELPQHIGTTDTSSSHPTHPSSSDDKSGTLVLVLDSISPRKLIERSRSKSYPSSDSPYAYTRQTSRCPSIVQVCRTCHEHFAVIRRTKHRLSEQPQFLNLKRSSVCLSDSRPTQFSVHLNVAEGRVFTFEASSPEVAREWVRVFSPLKSDNSSTESPQTFSPTRKAFVSMNSCAVLEEEDESEDSFPAPIEPSSKILSSIESKSKVFPPAAADKSPVDFSKPSMKLILSKDGSTLQRFPLPSNDSNRSAEVCEPVSKASSMPVLYEDDEHEASEE